MQGKKLESQDQYQPHSSECSPPVVFHDSQPLFGCLSGRQSVECVGQPVQMKSPGEEHENQKDQPVAKGAGKKNRKREGGCPENKAEQKANRRVISHRPAQELGGALLAALPPGE